MMSHQGLAVIYCRFIASDILISFALFQIPFPSIPYFIRTLHIHYSLFDLHFFKSSFPPISYFVRTFLDSSLDQSLFDSHFLKYLSPAIPYFVRTLLIYPLHQFLI
jgi:hypothetical protein